MPRYLELEISLRHIKPRIWRRLLLPAGASFADLHEAIQDSFGWGYAHLWEFRQPGRRGAAIAGVPLDDPFGEAAPDARRVRLGGYLRRAKQKCVYLYDFGDGWEHDVALRKLVELPDAFQRRLLAGRRAGPLEDCGGPWGYARFAAVARGEQDEHGEAEELLE